MLSLENNQIPKVSSPSAFFIFVCVFPLLLHLLLLLLHFIIEWSQYIWQWWRDGSVKTSARCLTLKPLPRHTSASASSVPVPSGTKNRMVTPIKTLFIINLDEYNLIVLSTNILKKGARIRLDLGH